MRYSITSNCNNVSMNMEKYVFQLEKLNFEPTANSAHTAERLALGKALNIYINYLMFWPSKMKM